MIYQNIEDYFFQDQYDVDELWNKDLAGIISFFSVDLFRLAK